MRTLLAVDEAGSFEGAARALGMSSFAISNRVKILEKTLNVVLIERAPTRTTGAGKILGEHMRKVSRLDILALKTHHTSSGSILGFKWVPNLLRTLQTASYIRVTS